MSLLTLLIATTHMLAVTAILMESTITIAMLHLLDTAQLHDILTITMPRAITTRPVKLRHSSTPLKAPSQDQESYPDELQRRTEVADALELLAMTFDAALRCWKYRIG